MMWRRWRVSVETKKKWRNDGTIFGNIHNWYSKNSNNEMAEIRGEDGEWEDSKAGIDGRNIRKKLKTAN